MRHFTARLSSVALLLALILCGSPGASADDGLSELARDAYIYTFPLHEMYRVRYQSLYNWVNPQRVAVNHFAHRRALSDHTSRRVTTPNNDTIYSSAFLDLSGGPLVLDVPAVANRYYSLAFMDFYTNNFAYIGTRTTGEGAGRYVIVGPAAKDAAVPARAQRIVSPTNAVWLLGRFLVVDENDLPNVHRLQDALKLTPLGAGSTPRFDGPRARPGRSVDYFAVVDHALTQNPPPAQDAALMARFAAIDVGPGRRFDPTRLDAAQQQALLRRHR